MNTGFCGGGWHTPLLAGCCVGGQRPLTGAGGGKALTGAGTFSTKVSAAAVPPATGWEIVRTIAVLPASQFATYTLLLPAAAATKTSKRAVLHCGSAGTL